MISFQQLYTALSVSDSKSDMHVSPIIGGSVGVALLLLTIFVLCIVICSISWSRKKKSYKFSSKELGELDSHIMMTTNPCHDINNQIRKEETQYDYIECDKSFQCVATQDDKKDNIKWDINPSYGKVQESETTLYDCDSTCTTQPGHNVTIQICPSRSSNSIQISEDQDGYVKIDQYYSHSREVANYLEIIVPNTKDESSAVCASDIDNLNTNCT